MKKNPDKILLVFDSSKLSPLSLQTAIDLAVTLQYEIQALYIEDINLINAVALPFSREVSLYTANVRNLQHVQLLKGLKADAENIRKQIEQKALISSIPVNFQFTRGHKVQVIQNRQYKVDMVLIPAVSSGSWDTSHLYSKRRLIALLYQQNSDLCHRALKLSLEQSIKEHCVLLVILDNQQSQQQILKEAGQLGVEVMIQVADFSEQGNILELLRKQLPQLLVLTEQNSLIEDEHRLKILIKNIESDILILRS